MLKKKEQKTSKAWRWAVITVHPACILSISSTFTIWINRLLHSPNLVARGLPVEYEFEGILPKGPYLPCVSMAGGALLAGYHRIKAYNCLVVFTMWLGVHYWNNARSVNFHCISKATDVFLKQPRRQMLCKDTVKESREIVMLWKRGSMREMITKVQRYTTLYGWEIVYGCIINLIFLWMHLCISRVVDGKE